MPRDVLNKFVAAVEASQLLTSDRVTELRTWANEPDADPIEVAKQLVKRGWLSSFQVKSLFKGKSADLFLNQYVLVEKLGEGGMGEVYRAHHRSMARDVALKVIRKERLANPDSIRRFRREVQAAAQLSHENVVMAYDAASSGDRHYFAMELVEGVNLAQLVAQRGALPIREACNYIFQSACGLQHAHECGMIHRDIKPSNLLLNKAGVVKILDMGLARLLDSDDGPDESRITKDGLIIGTPDYLSPEQARDSRTADIRSDIYALGCTFYFLLTGHVVFPGGTPTEKALKHTTAPAPPIDRPDLDPYLTAVLAKMLTKKPAQRFQTPDEVAQALDPYVRGVPVPVVAPVASLPTSRRRAKPDTHSEFRIEAAAIGSSPKGRTGRNTLLAGIFAMLVVTVLALLLLTQSRKQSPPPSLEPQFDHALGLTFRLVRPGTFEMGSLPSETGRVADETRHSVELTNPYYVADAELSVGQYRTLLGKLPPGVVEEGANLELPALVAMVEVEAVIVKLNKDSDGKRLAGWEYRLLTEAEWEYAARAGTKTPFSNMLVLPADKANTAASKKDGPIKPKSYPPNPWGLYDMHGNAAEWTADKYDAYPDGPTTNPTGPTGPARFAIRGGSWTDPPDRCRCAARRGDFPEKPEPENVGIRIAFAKK